MGGGFVGGFRVIALSTTLIGRVESMRNRGGRKGSARSRWYNPQPYTWPVWGSRKSPPPLSYLISVYKPTQSGGNHH